MVIREMIGILGCDIQTALFPQPIRYKCHLVSISCSFVAITIVTPSSNCVNPSRPAMYQQLQRVTPSSEHLLLILMVPFCTL
ncbi:hypothetical protein XELAEV_18030428mg [Xenopus laevis]|uniref:Uncharacterized protein n=1 Tax=Xenopus laevis TaxID=8355 RepID=A0A974CKS5_XENLA|nr:hypothetical protein XELAEV_18030428mg [Xenopus laevis]